MALTTAQQTQATQLSNAVPWVYPSVSDAGFWDNYFSGSGPSLTPAEQASGISMGPMTPSPAPQPQVLPGVNPDFVGPPSPQPAMPPAPAPAVPYQSELIRSLRQASPGFGSNNPGVTMLANPANSNTVIDFQRTVRPGLLPPPAPSPAPVAPPAPAPAPVSGGGGGGGGGTPPGGGGGPITIGPVTPLPRIDVVPGDDFVGPMPDDFVGPMPDDFVGPPAPDDQVAESDSVRDPGLIDVVDLPPLPGEADPDPLPPLVPMPPGGGDDDFVGPMPYFPSEDDFVGPMPDEFVGPPAPDEIPEGEIDVKPLGSSQPARDAINQIGDITEVGDPLDELGDIDLPDPVIDPPPVPPPEPDGGGDGSPTGGSGDFYVPPRDLISVSPDPLDEWEWIEPDIPEIPLPEIPAANFGDFNFSDAELLDFLFTDFAGGGGGGGMPFSDMVVLSQE